jgi:replication factor C subunit 1
MRFIKEIQAHMRLRASGDRHEIRQQYLPVLWYRLVQDLERRGKECVDEVIRLMDSYFLTKDDWDGILELAVGPMAMESVKIDTQTKSSFTRLYNQQSHPLPFMKANSVVAPKKPSGNKPDLEEVMDGSDDEDPTLNVDSEDSNDDELLSLIKDKYVKQPKKKSGSTKSSSKKVGTKGKQEGKVKGDEGDGGSESGEAENVRPQKGKGPGKGKAVPSRGRPTK